MDYEKLLREKESKMSIWGKESIVVIDEDIEISKNVVEELFICFISINI